MSSETVEDDQQSEEGLYPFDSDLFVLGGYVFFLLWASWLVVTSLGWRWEDKTMVLIGGVPTILFLLIEIVRRQYPDIYQMATPARLLGSDEPSLSDEIGADLTNEVVDRPKKQRQMSELQMLVAVIALPGMMYFLGLANTVPLYLLVTIYHFSGNWKDTLKATFIVSFAMYYLFDQLLGIIIWNSALGLPSILDVLPI
jgi:hypothetical protein